MAAAAAGTFGVSTAVFATFAIAATEELPVQSARSGGKGFGTGLTHAAGNIGGSCATIAAAAAAVTLSPLPLLKKYTLPPPLLLPFQHCSTCHRGAPAGSP